jgi:hypothetical protein
MLDGDVAYRHAVQTTGVALGHKITLFNSGIRLIIPPFTTTELSTFCTILAMNDDIIGRSTAGAAWSGDDVLNNGVFIDQILNKVTGTNVSEINKRIHDKAAIRQLIKVTDLQALMAGVLAVIYTNGYPVWHPCTKSDCNHNMVSAKGPNGEYLADSLINFGNITHTRTELLTDEDDVYWSKDVVNISEVLSYQSRRNDIFSRDFKYVQEFLDKTAFSVENKHYVTLRIPTLDEYISDCTQWCRNIESHIAKVVDQNRPENLGGERYQQFRKGRAIHYSNEIALGKYTPWIECITIVNPQDSINGRKVISDRTAIMTTLNEVYSSVPDALIAVTKLIKTMREKTTMTFAGVPNFKCPSCGEGQCTTEEHGGNLIPINLTNFFTTLLYWKYLD